MYMVRLAHFSDTHLGYQAYSATAVSGFNQRAVDIVAAFVNNIRDIIESDPPLVIHSGDVADKSRVDVAFLITMQKWFSEITKIRPDGTRRQLVIISGNHDQPRDLLEPCFLELFSQNMPGVHVVTSEFKQLGWDDFVDPDEALRDVVVSCLPHNQLRVVDFDVVSPVAGKINILTSHGVAGGSSLYMQSLGREYPVPTDVLARDWDYVALGHWHKPGPIMLTPGATGSKVWYAGSTENMGYGDARVEGEGRGWLDVNVVPGKLPEVTRKLIRIREMIRLGVVDAKQKDHKDIVNECVDRIRAADISGSIVSQTIVNVDKDIWPLVDTQTIRKAASAAMHYEIVPQFEVSEAISQTTAKSGALLDINTLLSKVIEDIVDDVPAKDVLAASINILEDIE